MPKYRPQPARDHMRSQRWSVRLAAQEMGINPSHLANALKGTVHPSPELRTKLPALLGVPLTDLFHPDLLEVAYDPTRDNWSSRSAR